MQWNFELLVKPADVPLTEGPVWDGEYLFFTHIQASRIMRYDPKTGAIEIALEGTNRTNGLAHDEKGRLFGCCSGARWCGSMTAKSPRSATTSKASA